MRLQLVGDNAGYLARSGQERGLVEGTLDSEPVVELHKKPVVRALRLCTLRILSGCPQRQRRQPGLAVRGQQQTVVKKRPQGAIHAIFRRRVEGYAGTRSLLVDPDDSDDNPAKHFQRLANER